MLTSISSDPTLLFDSAKLIEFCSQNDVKKLSLFGSVARGEANAQSDVDLLVEFSQRKSLLALVVFERQLSALFRREVDLLTEAAISPYLCPRIKQDLQVLYAA